MSGVSENQDKNRKEIRKTKTEKYVQDKIV